MSDLRNISIALGIAAALAFAGVAALVAFNNLEVQVPVNPLTPEALAAMSDIELCQLEHHTLTGIGAIRELGASGFAALYGVPWLVLLVTILLGSLAFRRLTRGSAAN